MKTLDPKDALIAQTNSDLKHVIKLCEIHEALPTSSNMKRIKRLLKQAQGRLE